MNKSVPEFSNTVAATLPNLMQNGNENTDPQKASLTTPFFPAASAEEANPAESENWWREARSFFLTGGNKSSEEDADCVPAALHGYLDVSRFRGAYPICFAPDIEPSVSLSQVVDRVIEEASAVENPPEALGAIAHHVEGSVREMVVEGFSGKLDALWASATQKLLGRAQWSASKKREFEEVANLIHSRLPESLLVQPCGGTAVHHIFGRSAASATEKKSIVLRDEADRLLNALKEIIQVDQSHSSEAQTPDHLKASVGKGFEKTLDFDALSELMGAAHLSDPLPEARKKRLMEAVACIEKYRPMLEPETTETSPVEIDYSPEGLADVRQQMSEHFGAMAAFVRALHIAALEIENRYRADFHDPYFLDFSASRMSDQERAVCPPFLAHIRIPDADGIGIPDLSDLLVPGWPIKVLVSLPKIVEKRTSPLYGAVAPHSAARIAEQSVAFREAFVMQCPASSYQDLQDGMLAGMQYAGPALFSVFIGSDKDAPGLSPYLRVAAAAESRMFPVFRYNPGSGVNWVGRFSVAGNDQPAGDFPVAEFGFTNAEGESDHVLLPFTSADFLSTDARFAQHFMDLDRDFADERIVPFKEYLSRDTTAGELRIPFILRVDASGRIIRTIVTRDMAAVVDRTITDWHLLRERGGIENSFVATAIEAEKQRLESEKDIAVAELNSQHEAELEKATGELAEEIVSRIAAGLLGVGGAWNSPLPDVQQAADVPKITERTPLEATETDEESTAVAEPEDEDISFDEPYIESIRCTTCNECTQLNSLLFVYNENRQATIRDISAGSFRDLVEAAEKCPVRIIHPGKPMNPDEPDLDSLIERAKPFQ